MSDGFPYPVELPGNFSRQEAMRDRLLAHGPLEVDPDVRPADIEAACIEAVVLAYDARGNGARVSLPATFVHWLLERTALASTKGEDR